LGPLQGVKERFFAIFARSRVTHTLIEGVGYVNELLARLTSSPVQDSTSTNRTLDSSPLTFPLNRTIYVDFTHDNQMAPIVSAIGLFYSPLLLNPIKPDANRSWVFSRIAPFAGNLVTEKYECGSASAKTEFVRFLGNDQVLDVRGLCGDGVGEDGLCELGTFLESQSFARSNGDGRWAECS
jgi:hypothetical protein